ncbi:ArsR/SmtB family transcription factor [Sphingomonas oryzagri]|jgi:DNA-binding transcriptional ArsR family regulator
MTAPADLEETAELLRVLGHGVRLSLLTSLIAGERSVGEIETQTGVGQPALSQQLGVLRKAGLVLTRREAKLVFYRIDHPRIALVSGLLDTFAGTLTVPKRLGDDRFSRGGTAATFARVGPAA